MSLDITVSGRHILESLKGERSWLSEFGCFRKSFLLDFVGGAEIECWVYSESFLGLVLVQNSYQYAVNNNIPQFHKR